MKKLSYIIIYGCLLCAASITAQTYSGGSGTEYDPYLISSNADMVTLAVAVSNGTDYSKNKYFLLTQNLTGINTEIGNSTIDDAKAFQGVFDGGGYTIGRVAAIEGLFGNTNSATIINLVVNGNFSFTSGIKGGLCAIASNTVFVNCINEASLTGGTYGGEGYLGGICGIANGCTFIDCINFGNLSYGSLPFGTGAGGIVGKATGTVLNRCYNEGAIISRHFSGGICGFAQESSINDSHNKGMIESTDGSTADYSYSGGISGSGNTLSINNCYNLGNISSVSNGIRCAGGIVGFVDETSNVVNCFNANATIYSHFSPTQAGRIAGDATSDNVSWCYSLATTLINGITVTSTDATSKHGIDGFIEYFQSQSWIAGNLGWDFVNTWYMPALPADYPLLKRLCTVTFNSQGGSSVASATAYTGEKVTRPADPVRSGFTFGGWYKEAVCTNAWNFDTEVVTTNITLFAKWTVLPVITINTQPAVTTNVTAGSISGYLIISASVMPSATLSYQWYSATTNSNTDGTAISGATSSTFAIPTTLMVAESPYYYFCEVRSSGANPVRSNVATVNVNTLVDAQMPNITVQPQGATYTQNVTATALTVTASVTDGGTLSYQWYWNATNSTTSGTAVGANSASYTPPTTTVGTRYYYVIVTNNNSNVNGTKVVGTTSNSAAITVTSLVNAQTPNITVHPQPATYEQNATATALTVAASVTDGGTLSYQWNSNTTNTIQAAP